MRSDCCLSLGLGGCEVGLVFVALSVVRRLFLGTTYHHVVSRLGSKVGYCFEYIHNREGSPSWISLAAGRRPCFSSHLEVSPV